jgi:hypothetical protein
MTIRAVLLGLFGAMAVCGFTYLNDVVMRQTPLIGNHMPIGVYGGLILFLLLVHPVLARVRRRLCLSGRELAVALTLTLVSCCIPASGLMRNLTAVMVAPYAFTQTQPGWREQGIIDLTPQAMRVDVSVDRDVVIDGFLKGLPRENLTESISLRDIPWSAYVRPLCFWLPLVAAVWVAMLGLSLVVHRSTPWAPPAKRPSPRSSMRCGPRAATRGYPTITRGPGSATCTAPGTPSARWGRRRWPRWSSCSRTKRNGPAPTPRSHWARWTRPRARRCRRLSGACATTTIASCALRPAPWDR